MSNARLTRSNSDKIIAGVCGGVAAYLDIDPVFIRLAFLILLFASGIGFPLYVILWIVMPTDESSDSINADIIQKNLSEMGESVTKGVNRIGRPGTVGLALILLGAYFLLNEFGLLGWMTGSIFWPLVIIGLGIFVLIRRSR